MDIRISGHQVDTGAALKEHVKERLQAIADKYFARALSAHTTFNKGPHDHGFRCDIVAHVMQGVILKGSADAADAHLSFDGASGKIEKQLRRYMRRLKDKHGNNVPAAPPSLDDGFDAGYTVFESQDDEDDGIPDNPLIIAETKVDIPQSSVSDAVMMLDLRNTNALLFINDATGTYNMVYRRHDGSIGWVEPKRAA
jgi:ribosomal subunit interface protein